MRWRAGAGTVAIVSFVAALVAATTVDARDIVDIRGWDTPVTDGIPQSAIDSDLTQLAAFLSARMAPARRREEIDAAIVIARSNFGSTTTPSRFTNALGQGLSVFGDLRTRIVGGRDQDSLAEWIYGGLRPAYATNLSVDVSPRATRLPSRLLANGIGYLRDDGDLFGEHGSDIARRWLEHFAGANGVIIDLRESAPGHRDLAWTLLPYLISPRGDGVVVGVAAIPLGGEVDANIASKRLEAWHYYRRTDSRLSAAARDAIDRFSVLANAPHRPADGNYSELHYSVSEPSALSVGVGGKPVVVLIDPSCYNACQAIAGMLAALPNVTLLGTTTRGGAGLTERVVLAHTRVSIDVRTAVMWTSNGKLIDGRGVVPQVELAGPDSVHIGSPDDRDLLLEAALHLLTARPTPL